MINFRYHIVSLMAVFLALAVGIAAGVSLGPSVNEGVVQQAAQDRKQVTDLRAELDRRNSIDQYRQTYDQQVGQIVTEGVLAGSRVAIVQMPTAPTAVAQAVTTAVTAAGGEVVREVKISDDVFDPAKSADVIKALADQPGLELNENMSAATMFGTALARSIAAKAVEDRDDVALAAGKALTGAGLANISGDSVAQAQLVVVVGAPATTPPPAAEISLAHVDVDMSLAARAVVVLAGPNSEEIAGTDVLAVRSSALAADKISTVDVADLSSGVTTTILAGKEQLLGKPVQHYGALAKADAVAPQLPVR